MYNEAEINDMIYNADHALWSRHRFHDTQSVWYYNCERDMLWYCQYDCNGNIMTGEPAYTQNPYTIFVDKNCEIITCDEMFLRLEGKTSVRYV